MGESNIDETVVYESIANQDGICGRHDCILWWLVGLVCQGTIKDILARAGKLARTWGTQNVFDPNRRGGRFPRRHPGDDQNISVKVEVLFVVRVKVRASS